MTQPKKLGLVEMRVDPFHEPKYAVVRPLLAEMASQFSNLTLQMASLESTVPKNVLGYFQEIVDTLNITTQRAIQVYGLYDYVGELLTKPISWRNQRLEEAKQALEKATEIVRRREKNYRVPVERIGGWRTNPTVYRYGYLWTVHSLQYFWRDYAQAIVYSLDALGPCYMNFIVREFNFEIEQMD